MNVIGRAVGRATKYYASRYASRYARRAGSGILRRVRRRAIAKRAKNVKLYYDS